jgi:glutathione S-transferase
MEIYIFNFNKMLMFLVLLSTVTLCSAAVPSDVTVRYFDSRGRAEAIRLTLSALEIKYDEVKYARCGDDCEYGITDWTAAKAEGLKSGMIPFGQVPSVTYYGEHLAQSMAILRYLCAENERAPDIDVAYDIDVFTGGYNDLRGKYSKMAYDSSIWNEGSTKIQEYQAVAKTWLGYMEKLLTMGKWVGGSMHWTYADILAFEIMDMNLRANPDIVNEYPNLMDVAKRIAALPGIAAYLKSDRRRPHQNGKSAFFDTPKNPIKNPFDWNVASEL